MEKFLFVLLISIIICQKPYNVKNKDGEPICGHGFDVSTEKPEGVSECIDLGLWSESLWGEIANYDHCCYARYQLAGVMYAKCVGLTEEEYLDIVEYIRMNESGKEKLGSPTRQLKIYDINCFSSYLKIFGAYLLLALLF